MVIKLFESEFNDGIYIFFKNVHKFERLADTIERNRVAEFVDHIVGIWSITNIYKINDFKFHLYLDEDLGICIRLPVERDRNQDAINYEKLRNLGEELLALLKKKIVVSKNLKRHSGILLKEKDFRVLISLEKKVRQIPFIHHFEFPITYTCEYGFHSKGNKIDVISIFDRNLKEFPMEVLELDELTVLNLAGNGIKTIPKEIKKLCSLKTLNIAHNGMDEFPRSICEVSSLEYLNLQLNRLKEIPECLGKLRNLKHLYLNENADLRNLADSIWDLGNLEVLDLNTTIIKDLSEKIQNLEKLTSLNITLTEIEKLPLNIKKLKKLKWLYIDFNPPSYSKEELEMIEQLKQNGIKIWKQ
ncbi:MAG: leucine-rich repeat domain-containing protein [Promethearchaeota archaeon]|jgi:Leucine-rich repeat (LRR) protein